MFSSSSICSSESNSGRQILRLKENKKSILQLLPGATPKRPVISADSFSAFAETYWIECLTG
ncbi:hypothetical protein HNQ41_001859 [Texcoconibacillus texcoconensis]|uniref:Uncharacterized protein n=1 Tax=Texcoconibacillus texcoconensis TaxID=1095777 RepID=A0A840QQN8_9BACI|nr:hypothetical protein [Texcoconibacillus texcoconensis]